MELEIAILAGGCSRRMGTDKARLRLGRRTLLGHVRAAALATGWPVRVIRRDLKPGCGPLGGIYTALKTTRANAVLFLACDMPFITPELLHRLARRLGRRRAVFCHHESRTGFPFILTPRCLPEVESALAQGARSLQKLAKEVRASRLRIQISARQIVVNVNTPAEWAEARATWKTLSQQRAPCAGSLHPG